MLLNTQNLTPNKFVQILTVIYMFLLSGLITFLVFVLFIFDGDMQPVFDSNDMLLVMYPLVAVGAIIGSHVIFKKIVASAERKSGLKAKLAIYQTAFIVKLAIAEGPAFLGIVLGMITDNSMYIAIAGVIIVYLFLQMPNRNKIEKELNLRGDERNKFNRFEELID